MWQYPASELMATLVARQRAPVNVVCVPATVVSCKATCPRSSTPFQLSTEFRVERAPEVLSQELGASRERLEMDAVLALASTVTRSKKKSIFENVEDLIGDHPSTSEEVEKLECPMCSKSYLTFFGLRRHLKGHLDGSVHLTCPQCNKEYNSPGALKMHMNTHLLPCVCPICGKSFSRPWLLKGHARTHTGEKPYECSSCGRSFADRSNLKAHEQTHATMKKHQCSNCDQTFARVQVKLKHETNCTGRKNVDKKS